MTGTDCLFCKIAAKKVPAGIVYESDEVVGFNDINPQAPVHVLFIPKKHISGAHELSGAQEGVVESLILAANQIARQKGVGDSGYRLVINCKGDAGQTVNHIHLHLIGGRKMGWPPG